jgi:hypothetical protein
MQHQNSTLSQLLKHKIPETVQEFADDSKASRYYNGLPFCSAYLSAYKGIIPILVFNEAQPSPSCKFHEHQHPFNANQKCPCSIEYVRVMHLKS